MGEQDHNAYEHQENHGRVRDLVADRFNTVQEFLQNRFGRFIRLTHAANPPEGLSTRTVPSRWSSAEEPMGSE
jgi:hypothetical protein